MIKIVVAFLILLNIGLFAWGQWFSDPMSKGRLKTLATDVPTIGLANQPVVPETSDQLPSAQAARCVALGPFSGDEDLSDAKAWLDERTVAYGERTKIETAISGYWVYLAPAKNREAAEKTLGKLNKAKVEDTYIQPDGEFKYAVSLGFYHRRAAAQSRVESMYQHNLAPKMQEREKETELFFLDFYQTPELSEALASFGSEPGKIVRTQASDACPESAKPADTA